MNLKQTTASLIKSAREKAGMSQLKLAKKAHLSSEWLCRIEGGYRFPSMFTLNRIAAALKVEVASLIGSDKQAVNVNHQPKRKK